MSCGSVPASSAARSRPTVLEMVTPAWSAWKRARFAIGTTPRRLRSIVPSSSSVSRPRNPVGGVKSVAVRARRRMKSGYLGAWRSISTSGRTISSRADDLAEVERDRRTHEVAAIRALQAVVEHPHPFRLGEPPLAVSSQHLGVVGAEAAAGERHVHLGGQVGEVGVDLGAARVGVGQRIVLVRGERRLPAGGRAECEPRPGRRRRRPLGGDQLDEAGGRRVGLERDHAADVERRDAGPDQAHDHLRHVQGRLDDLVHASGVRDRAPERERRSALEVHQVGRRHHAERRSGRVDDRQVVDAGVEHVDHRVDGEALGRERLCGRGHEAARPECRRADPRRRASGAGRSR